MPGTTSFPTGLDTFPNITSSTQEDAAGFEHDVVHNNEGAAIAALQAKVGINSSAVTTSHDYKIGQLATRSLYHRETFLTAASADDILTLLDTPFATPSTTLKIYKNGTRLVIGTDITFAGLVGTLSSACSGGEAFIIEYWSTTNNGAPVLTASGITLSRRYWRISVTANNGSAYFGIAEFQFRNTVGGSNITSFASAATRASASTEVNSSNSARHAFGTGLGVGWLSAASPTPPQWLQYVFDTPETILQISMAPNGNQPTAIPSAFTVQNSPDGVTWTTVKTVTGQTGWSGARTFNL